MSLFDRLLHPHKAPEAEKTPQAQPPEVTGTMINRDEQDAATHQQIQTHVGQALGVPAVPGSTVPPIETHPLQTDPLKVINPLAPETANVQEALEDTIPDSYKRADVPGWVSTVSNLFGENKKDAESMYEQVATHKSYRTTEAPEFINEINRKAQQEKPVEELKKAA